MRRPSIEVAIAHVQCRQDPIGAIPASIDTSVLDVDDGDPAQLILEFPPLADVDTPRGGHHLFYPDTEPRGNGTFQTHGCSGDIRSGRGYVVLWNPGKVADAISKRNDWAVQFPADLFEAQDVPVPEVSTAPVVPITSVKSGWKLEKLYKGCRVRNIALFDTVRFWAYAERKPGKLDAWNLRVLDFALLQNQRLGDPLPLPEVHDTAYSISTWTWCGGGPVDHSPRAQRRRGIKSYYGKADQKTLELVEDRNQLITELHRKGWTQKKIASRTGLSQQRISRILAPANTTT